MKKNKFLDSKNSQDFAQQNLFFNICFDKGELKNLLSWFLNQYGEKLTIEFLEKLKQVGFHQATRAGLSLGIDDLQIPETKAKLLSDALIEIQLLNQKNNFGTITSVEKSQRMIDTWNQTSEILRQTTVQNFRTRNPLNPIFMMAFSGARGNISQVRQLVAMRGLMADPQGAILEFPIQSNFREGLTLTEYLISCYGARKGLVDTALRTATSGYLTRRLVDAVQHVVITMVDCGTVKGMVLKNKNLTDRLIGRVLAKNIQISSTCTLTRNTVISPFLSTQLSVKFQQILVRSPLTCEAEKSVCQYCYGWNLAHGRLVSLGEAVGIIAAQSIGEPGTQLTMRTFHTGGVGVFGEQGTKLFVAPFQGKVNFLEKLSGVFVRTSHGIIVYMVKNPVIESNRIILQIRSQTGLSFSIAEKDLPPGSLLWVKQGQTVLSGQIVAQGSQIKTSKHQFPESLHPVQSPIDGEIFFERIKILQVLTIKQDDKKSTKKRQNTETSPNLSTFKTLLEKNWRLTYPNPNPIVSQIGTFWVLGSSIQKEFHTGKIFLRSGDLVSKKTPLSQYNLYLPEPTKLQTTRSKLRIGFLYLNFEILSIRFFKMGYFITPKSSNKKSSLLKNSDLLFYKKFSIKNLRKDSVIWFPARFKVKFPGYFSYLPHSLSGSGWFSKKTSFALGIKGAKHEKDFLASCDEGRGNFLWLKQVLYFSNQFPQNYFKKIFIFNSLSTFFKTNGILQVQKTSNRHVKMINFWTSSFELNRKSGLTESQISFFISSARKSILQKLYSFSFSFPISAKIEENGWKHQNNSHLTSLVLKKSKTWLFLSAKKINKPFLQVFSLTLENGKSLDNIVFSAKKINLFMIHSNSLQLLPYQRIQKKFSLWYDLRDFLFQTKENFKFDKYSFNRKKIHIKRQSSQTFVFYTLLSKIKYQNKTENLIYLKFLSPQRKVYKIEIQTNFMVAGDFYEFFLPEKKSFFETSFFIQPFPNFLSISSPFTTKQLSTHSLQKKTPKTDILLLIPSFPTCLSTRSLLQFQLTLIFDMNYSLKISHTSFLNSQKQSFSFSAVEFFLYDDLILKNMFQYTYETFPSNKINFEKNFTKGFLKLKKDGEFRRFTQTQKQITMSILENHDIVTFLFPFFQDSCLPNNKKIGNFIRWGDRLENNFGFHRSGEILKLTPKNIVVRTGIPILASSRGILHIFHNDLIQKNQLLLTLKSRRFQTEDIVQGIPKIEQLFEARRTQGGERVRNSVHSKLQKFFFLALHSSTLDEAVLESVKRIQLFLIENILDAYSNQGVKISEKHVEIIVRQMTNRVKIIDGGDTGFLSGELVHLTWIQKINKNLQLLRYRQATYQPLVLGITKSVLQSESFLLAASFQEVSRVLVRSALTNKSDFLRGLQEKVILGQRIPAGTGLFPRPKHSKRSKVKFELPA